jgi:prepilin-type N-terminal cleavage/methylation domain-containing protein
MLRWKKIHTIKQNRLSLSGESGFTITELLIVLVVIGILASLVVVSFTGITDNSRKAKSQYDLKAFGNAAQVARVYSDKTMRQITGSDCTGCSCTFDSGGASRSVALYTLPDTDPCWVDYRAAITALGTAAKVNFEKLLDGDAWGSPYVIDENEDVPGYACTYLDYMWSVGKDGVSSTVDDNVTFEFARYKLIC